MWEELVLLVCTVNSVRTREQISNEPLKGPLPMTIYSNFFSYISFSLQKYITTHLKAELL